LDAIAFDAIANCSFVDTSVSLAHPATNQTT
jgi:hypothetical protein